MCNGVQPRAAHAAETFLAECGGKSHNRNPLGSNEVHQTVTDRRGPGPWFSTSTCALAVKAAGPPPQRRMLAMCSGVQPQSGARPVDVHPGIYPYKARYQVVGVDVCYKAFFIRCMFDRIGQSPHLLALYQVYHSHADITNRILLNPLNSLTQSAQTYSALMHHIDTACRESRFKTCRMCSSSIFWAEGYREYMAKPCVKSMAKENEHHITTVSGDSRLASPRSWEMHRVPRMVCLESFLKGLKLSYFLQLSKLEVKE